MYTPLPMKSRILGLVLMLGLPSGRESLLAEDSRTPLRQLPAAPLVRKNEIKLFVTAANAAQAMKALKLDEHRFTQQTVCFFDTGNRALEASHLILRARQKGDGPGQSTVKVRAADAAMGLSDIERSLQPEQDWTNENEPTLSRSLDDAPLASGLVPAVAAGNGEVATLFNETQRKLVTERMKNFRWDSLRRYGPAESRVWRQQWKLHGFPENVTVEFWHLAKDGRTQDMLEVSASAKAETEAQAQELARKFFAAARAAGWANPRVRRRPEWCSISSNPDDEQGNETTKPHTTKQDTFPVKRVGRFLARRRTNSQGTKPWPAIESYRPIQKIRRSP